MQPYKTCITKIFALAHKETDKFFPFFNKMKYWTLPNRTVTVSQHERAPDVTRSNSPRLAIVTKPTKSQTTPKTISMLEEKKSSNGGFGQRSNWRTQNTIVTKQTLDSLWSYPSMAVAWKPLFSLILVSALIIHEEWVSSPSCQNLIPSESEPDRSEEDLKVMMVANLLLTGSESGYLNRIFRDHYTARFFAVIHSLNQFDSSLVLRNSKKLMGNSK